jgi:hypothetical protein
MDLDLQRQLTTQGVGERRLIGPEHPSIGHDRDVGAQCAPVALEKRDEIRAADLFLALEHAPDIDRQPPTAPQQRLDRLHVREELSFVVARAAPAGWTS